MAKIVNSNKVSNPIKDYSHGIIINNFIHLSGQIGIDIETKALPQSFEQQTRQVFRNIRYILETAKTKLNRIVKLVVYLQDFNNLELFNQICSSIFSVHKIAISIVIVPKLMRNALIQIDTVAILKI